MIRITKIFHFEMAHALDGYNGACRNIHGHSYELHVTIASVKAEDAYLHSPGFIIDFKELKKIINLAIIEKFDHKLYYRGLICLNSLLLCYRKIWKIWKSSHL
ncbi:6-pyruvoyl trahydropterin synthase family protein [Mucilaginibacter puniceus]